MKTAKRTFLFSVASILLILSLFAVAAKIKTPSDSFSDALYRQMIDSSVTSLKDISDMYAMEWVNYLPMSLPHEDSFLRTMDQPVPLIFPQQKQQWEKVYSAAFIDGLVPVVKEGITVFPIQLLLNSSERKLTIFNANEKVVATVPIDDEFLPVEWAKECFGSATVETADRMQLSLDLILEADINLYIALQELKAAARPKEADFPIIMMAYDGPAVTNIKFVAAERTGDCVMLTIAYPDDYTNDLEIFGCTNLLIQDWSLLATTNVNLSTNWIEWVDLDSSNHVQRFYDAWNADADTDSDGLSDGQENRIYGTDHEDADSDDDMLSDGVEIGFGTDPLNYADANSNSISDDWELYYFGGAANPIADPDGDGLDNEAEYNHGTNPNNADTDGDTLNDYEEIYEFDSNPTIADTDGDGLSDAEEALLYFTTPDDADSDNDGLSDYAEVVTYGTFPRKDDSDEDGLNDGTEISLGTNPLMADTDGDGIDDAYEHSQGWSALNAANASEDDDSDGYSNLTEYQWCTDPASSNSAPPYYQYQRLIVIPPGSNSVRTIADSTHYRVLAVGDLGAYSARLRVRPMRGPDGELAAQHLIHSQAEGIYINGTEASSLGTPIVIPAQSSAVEYTITADMGITTNLHVQLADTNDNVGSYCSAYFYSPDLPRVDFYGPQEDTYAASAATLWVGVPDDTNACRVYVDQDQAPSDGYGVPLFRRSDWSLLSVTGPGATNTASLNYWNHLAVHGFGYDYRDSAANTRGLHLSPGTFTLIAGMDMNADGIIQSTEGRQTCTVHVVEADINGDYNRTGTPSDSTNEASEVSFTNTYGMVILANCDDDDGDGEPDCSDNIIGTNDLSEISVLEVDKLGIASNLLTNLTVKFELLTTNGSASTAAWLYTDRSVGAVGCTSTNLSAAILSGSGSLELGIEGRKFGEQVVVKITIKHGSTVLDTDEIRILIAPWIGLSNAEPVLTLYCGGEGDTNFSADMNSLFGATNIVWEIFGRWRQDECEFGYVRTGNGQTSSSSESSMLDSTEPELANYFKTLIAPDKGWDESQKAYLVADTGNVDVSPPDASNPFGRLIIGDDLAQGGFDFFEKQKLQCPIITIETEWLRVGHMDEMVSIVPNGSGYVICVGDLTNAISILQDYTAYPTNEVELCLSGGFSFSNRAELITIYTNAANTGVVAQVQGYLDNAATNLSAELNVTIIRLPVAYTLDVGGSGDCRTFLPNSINAVIANFSGTTKMGIPDPKFAPFRTVITNRLSSVAATKAFITCDGAWSYDGGPHCASNSDKMSPSVP